MHKFAVNEIEGNYCFFGHVLPILDLDYHKEWESHYTPIGFV